MKAVVESIGKVGSRAQVDGHAFVFDQPRSVPGGEDRGRREDPHGAGHRPAILASRTAREVK